MQNSPQEEEAGQKLPIDLMIQKANQLRACYLQFLNIKSPYSTGLYVIYKWGFELSKQANRSGHIFFKVLLINLTTQETIFRIWEAKDTHLLNDSKLPSGASFGPFGYMFADWWQELYAKGLSRAENQTLELAVTAALGKFEVKVHDISITNASIRIRLDKSDVHIDYKLWMESTDDDNKVYALRAHISFSKDFQSFEIVDIGLENINNPKSNILPVKDQEDALLVARTEMITKGKSIVFEGDAVIDYYYLRTAEIFEKGVIKATFDLLVICQDARMVLVAINFLLNSQKKTIEIQKAKQINYSNKTIEYIMHKGNRLQSWQKFSPQETTLDNPTLFNIANTWILQNRNPKYVVREILRAETRLKRDPKTLMPLGFEYIVVARVGLPMMNNSTQEWKVFATLEDEPIYDFISIKEDIDFVDRARRTSEFTSFLRARVPRGSDFLNSSLVIIKERESARKNDSRKVIGQSVNFSPKPSEMVLSGKKILNPSDIFGIKEESLKKRSSRYIDSSFDSKLKKSDELNKTLPVIRNSSSSKKNQIKIFDSATLDLENDTHYSKMNDIDAIARSLVEKPYSNMMNQRPTTEHFNLRTSQGKKGEIRPFSSNSPKNTIQVFSTLITSQNLKKKRNSNSKSPEGNFLGTSINFPAFPGPSVKKRPKNIGTIEKKKNVLCEILEKQLIEHKKNFRNNMSNSFENSFS